MIYIVSCETCVKFNIECFPCPLHAKDATKQEHEACEFYSFEEDDSK